MTELSGVRDRPRRSTWRQVLVPGEHGGWAFLAEPVLLGLLVSFSRAGTLVGVAAVAAFLSRRPLRLLVADRRERRRSPRTVAAERAFAACALAAALALAGALSLARGPVLLAVGLAAPFAAAALAFDAGGRSRAAAAEMSGALALGGAAAGIALAGGWAAAPALGLWMLLAARTVPTILYVRARLRLDRGQRAGVATALAAHLAALGAASVLASRGLAPWLGVAAVGLLALRAGYGLSPRRPALSTLQLGLGEIAFGLVVVAAVAAGVRIGF